MMTKFILPAAIAVLLLGACSDSEAPVNQANKPVQSSLPGASSATDRPDYKMICQRLIALAALGRKAALTASCEADYQSLLPKCQNAAAVNDCYANMKGWDERLACMDSCKRN